MNLRGSRFGLLAALLGILVGALFVRHSLAQCIANPASDWRNTFTHPQDPFLSAIGQTPDMPRWVKFTILLCDPQKVYFHDSFVYPFHYDFARSRLPLFASATREQFDAATLHAPGQQAVLGAVLVPGSGLFGETNPHNELAIQLVRQDAYTREQVRDYFNLVKSKIVGPGGPGQPGVPVLYFPTFEQQPSAFAERAWLSQQGIEIGDTSRWLVGNVCYAFGWAVGTLTFVPGSQVGDAFRTGAITSDDILLTDGVPAEVPPVAGIISLTPSTPNSHVALLSATWNIPFVHLVGADAARAQSLVGRRVALRARYFVQFGGVSRADIVDVQDELSPALLDHLHALKQPAPLAYQPMQIRGAYSVPVDNLTPADGRYVGGKAANYGFLRRAIPGNSRTAVAFTFDLWNAYLDQTLLNGRTLRQEIHARLDGFTYPPADPQALSTALAGVRDLFTNTSVTTFSAGMQSGVLSTLQNPAYGFDPSVKIRFRSSTNVEDTETFTGAGLYDSFSGCLQDDLDADNSGPSACDPSEPNERGVFRAIRKVYASFYNDNAFLARLRLGVNEDQVGMAMLCHHSFPDSTEAANGVVVISRTATFGGRELTIVSQVGATSVTNPSDGSIPEEVSVYYSGIPYVSLVRSSSRVVLGDTVMTWDSDYENLSVLIATVADRYAMETGKTRYKLDFEFKKTLPSGVLEIKQVRPLPLDDTTPTLTPLLINKPGAWVQFSGEGQPAYAFAKHRLKAEFDLQTDTKLLDAAGLASGILSGASRFRLNDGCTVHSQTGRPETFTQGSVTYTGTTMRYRWRLNEAANPREYTLSIENIPALMSKADGPLVWLDDFGFYSRHQLTLEAAYNQPVPSVDHLDQPTTTTMDLATLCPLPSPSNLSQSRTISQNGITVVSDFAWVPGGAAAGYTFDLSQWEQTTITGLISRPITLRSRWSQTYNPHHHNFGEDFVLDPRLEPGISPAILQELRTRGVSYLVATTNNTIRLYNESCTPCPADLDSSGSISVQDLFTFLDWWFNADPRADFSGSGDLSVQDLFDFLSAYFAGCA